MFLMLLIQLFKAQKQIASKVNHQDYYLSEERRLITGRYLSLLLFFFHRFRSHDITRNTFVTLTIWKLIKVNLKENVKDL